MKVKYSDKHIDSLVDRLKQYEAKFENSPFEEDCDLCQNTGNDCADCIIHDDQRKYSCLRGRKTKDSNYIDPLDARDYLEGNFDVADGLNLKLNAINWYNEMIRIANENLERSGSKWTIKGKKYG